MSKTFSYGSNTTTSTVQYNVKASIGSLSQEQKFSVPAGEECQDKYVLTVPDTIYYGWLAGTTTSLPVTSTLNGGDYPYKVIKDKLSGATVSSNSTEIVFTANQNGDYIPEPRGTITITQEQAGGQINTRNVDVYQKGYVKLKATISDDLDAVITSDWPAPCNVQGTALNETTGVSEDFTLLETKDKYELRMKVEANDTVRITKASLDCDDKYDIFY